MTLEIIRFAGWSLLLGAVLASVLCWLSAAQRLRHGEELLAWSPRRMVPWGLVDIGFCFILLVIVDAAGLQLAGFTLETDLTKLDAAEQSRAFLTMAVGRLGVAVLSVLVLMGRAHASAKDVGLSAAHFYQDLKIGGCAFLMVAPVVYGLQKVLSMVWTETSHPLVTIVQDHPEMRVFAAACATAVLAAPPTEEILLRVVFQGWLEKAALWRGTGPGLLLGTAADPEPEDQWPNKVKVTELADRPPLWPIAVSSLLFALMHWRISDPSPDPIPLFVFALALGFVYQRTHRLLPCMVMHVLLNAISMAVLGLSTWQPDVFN